MRQHCRFTEAFRKVVSDTFGQPSRIYEDQRGAVRQDKFREPIINLAPHFVTGDDPEFVFWDFHAEIQLSTMAAVDNPKLFVRGNKLCDIFDRPYGRGQTDSLKRRLPGFYDEIIETSE
ncbi:MAG TPA: hypothetical protein VKE42_11260 [Candidatus Cybelea sp.]|nr:hypothetical protein [Candidatus Cybelea sp.]